MQNKNIQHKNRKTGLEIGDDMLDQDGKIVEPDVRKSISKYLKQMGLRETTYPIYATFFANPNEDPQPDDFPEDDPVGLKLLARQREMEDEVRCEGALRDLTREIIDCSQDT